eukprot:scaffold79250_cov28-Tisochrysis_lutea.AAC.1
MRTEERAQGGSTPQPTTHSPRWPSSHRSAFASARCEEKRQACHNREQARRMAPQKNADGD